MHRNIILSSMTLLSIAALLAVRVIPSGAYDRSFDMKIRAATRMREGMKMIREAREDLELPSNIEEDPNGTGLIGSEHTAFTTTLGPLEVKRTVTNPDFAALMVHLLQEAGVNRGDLVAAGISGSFPGLALSLYSAAEVMGVELMAISSIGASTYGATDPEFTWLDMETVLWETKLISRRSVAASPGGDEDQLENPFFPEARALAIEAIHRNEIPAIVETNFENALEARMKVYSEAAGGRPYSVFVNIGGAEVNLGTGSAGYNLPSGLLRKPIRNAGRKGGVLFRMYEDGAEIVNLLNIRDICLKYGLPIDPVPLPVPGRGAVYSVRERSFIPVSILFLFLLSLALLIWFDKKQRKDGAL